MPLLTASLLTFFILSSCNRSTVSLDYTNAKDEVPALGNLTFRFDQPLVKDSLLDRWDSTQYVSFEPRIPGRFRWEHPDELVFSPLQPLAPATTSIVSLEGRYAKPRRGELAEGPLFEMAWAFSLPGQWSAIDPGTADCDAATGELTLPANLLGLPYNEVMVTYTAGLATIGDDIKSACAQIVRNAQATPVLNASRTRIDTMQMEYFSSSLLDETVKTWLRPYVANRLG